MSKTRVVNIFLVLFFIRLNAVDFSMDQAKRVEDFLNRIAQKPNNTIFLKKITFSESELNSYLNLIYTKKFTPEIKYLFLNLYDKNQVSCEAKIVLNGPKYDTVPQFLRDITVKGQGKIECANYRMRFLIQDLYVNNTRFSPEILDEAYVTAQGNVNIKKSLFDWFTLLPGLKNMNTGNKTVTFFY